MYNEGLKINFIRNYTQSINTANVATTVFAAFAPHLRGCIFRMNNVLLFGGFSEICTGQGHADERNLQIEEASTIMEELRKNFVCRTLSKKLEAGRGMSLQRRSCDSAAILQPDLPCRKCKKCVKM